MLSLHSFKHHITEAFSESEGMAPFILILSQDGYGCLVLRPFHSELWENSIPEKF
jgi:hypothetical protein